MKPLKSGSLLLLLCLFCVAPGRSQTSVYAVAGLADYGFNHLNFNSITTKGDTAGFGAGLFYNFPIQSRVTVGLDGRFQGSSGLKGGVLGGAALRVGFVPKRVPLRPFFQIGGGVVHSSYSQGAVIGSGFATTFTTVQQPVTNGAAQIVFGLDIRLSDRVDLRAPELGSQAGGGSGTSAFGSFLNLGLVYHLKGPRA